LTTNFTEGGGIGFTQPPVTFANIVIIQGPSAGLFVYNGTGSLGNPPILSAVAPGTTTDLYGNTVLPVLTVGNLAGNQYLNVDQFGDLTIKSGVNAIEIEPFTPSIQWFANTANPQIIIDGSRSAEYFYSPSGAAGNLALSIAIAAHNDSYGNAGLSGFTSYLAGTPTTSSQLNSGGLFFNNAAMTLSPASLQSSNIGAASLITLSSGSSLAGTAGSVTLQSNGILANATCLFEFFNCVLFIPALQAGQAIGTAGTGFNFYVTSVNTLNIKSSGVGASVTIDANENITTLGNLTIGGGAVGLGTPQSILTINADGLNNQEAQAVFSGLFTTFTILSNLSGYLKFIASDGGTYIAGKVMDGSGNITFNSTGAAQNVPNMSVPLRNGVKYLIRGMLRYVGGQAAGTAVFSMTTPGFTNQQLNGWFISGATVNNIATGIGGNQTSPTLRNGSGDFWHFEGVGVASSNGTLQVQAVEGTVGDHFTITSGYLEAVPIAP